MLIVCYNPTVACSVHACIARLPTCSTSVFIQLHHIRLVSFVLYLVAVLLTKLTVIIIVMIIIIM